MVVEATVSMVKKKLQDLHHLHSYNFLRPKLKTKLDEAVEKLHLIVSMLETAGYRQESYAIKEWTIEILRVVYNVEDSIDTFVLSTTSSKLQRRRNLCVPYVVLQEIRFLNKIEKFMEKIDYCNTHAGYSKLLTLHLHNIGVAVGPSSQISRPHENRDWQEIYDYFKHSLEIVGSEKTTKEVMNRLNGKDEGGRIIWLSCGSGTGKSTLIRFHFYLFFLQVNVGFV
ncbi:hypothetical protein SLE2022_306520 [Rubroshorea leprosula]